MVLVTEEVSGSSGRSSDIDRRNLGLASRRVRGLQRASKSAILWRMLMDCSGDVVMTVGGDDGLDDVEGEGGLG